MGLAGKLGLGRRPLGNASVCGSGLGAWRVGLAREPPRMGQSALALSRNDSQRQAFRLSQGREARPTDSCRGRGAQPVPPSRQSLANCLFLSQGPTRRGRDFGRTITTLRESYLKIRSSPAVPPFPRSTQVTFHRLTMHPLQPGYFRSTKHCPPSANPPFSGPYGMLLMKKVTGPLQRARASVPCCKNTRPGQH